MNVLPAPWRDIVEKANRHLRIRSTAEDMQRPGDVVGAWLVLVCRSLSENMSERKHKDDVLDPVEARRFLWRQNDPEPEPAPAPAPPAAPPPTPAEQAREDAHALAKLREIAARIDRVWRMSGKTQASATIALLDKVELDLRSLVGLGGTPELCVRFAHLVVRHYDRLPPRRRRSLTHSLSWLELDGPEVGALLVDAARRGKIRRMQAHLRSMNSPETSDS